MLTDRKITTYEDNIKALSDTPSSDGINAETLKAFFDGRTDKEIKASINGIVEDLTSTTDGSSGADNIASAALTDLGQTLPSNVRNQLILLAAGMVTRYTSAEIDALINSINTNAVKAVTFDSDTGVFTITKINGDTATIDTNIEKIPASLTLETIDSHVYLVVTNNDGTKTQADVTSLLNVYTANNTNTIDLTINNYAISASIKASSIMLSHLNAEVTTALENYKTVCQAAAQSASTDAATATAKATEAANSASTSTNNANTTQILVTNAGSSATNAKTSETNAKTSETNAKTSETNSEYWAKQAKSIADGTGYMTKMEYDSDGDGVVNDSDKLNGELPSYYDNQVIPYTGDSINIPNTQTFDYLSVVINGNTVLTPTNPELPISPDNVATITSIGDNGSFGVQKCGKNLFDGIFYQGYPAGDTSSNGVSTLNPIRVRQNTKYTATWSSNKQGHLYITTYNKDMAEIRHYISLGNASTPRNFTTTLDECYVKFHQYNSNGIVISDINNFQLEMGDTATEFVSFVANKNYSIPLKDTTGTTLDPLHKPTTGLGNEIINDNGTWKHIKRITVPNNPAISETWWTVLGTPVITTLHADTQALLNNLEQMLDGQTNIYGTDAVAPSFDVEYWKGAKHAEKINGKKITVSTIAPTGNSTGDVWIDLN